MTARAGDALSHVNFNQPPTQFSKAIFQDDFEANFPSRLHGRFSRPDFQAPIRGESAATILPPARALRMARQLQAQSFLPDLHNRHEPFRGNRSRLFLSCTCRDFVNTNEHFISK
jgi:hypothetical protein